MDRKLILWVYLQKHLDGIVAYLKGHRSQREDVTGRIKDALVYLILLDAMIYEENQITAPSTNIGWTPKDNQYYRTAKE